MPDYSNFVNPQWERLLSFLGMNVSDRRYSVDGGGVWLDCAAPAAS